MTGQVVYRIQDANGSGPFKPGFRRVWSDDSGPARPPAELLGKIALTTPRETWLGSAVRSRAQLRLWFTRSEERRLKRLGYQVVALEADEILAENEHEVIIERARRFNEGIIA